MNKGWFRDMLNKLRLRRDNGKSAISPEDKQKLERAQAATKRLVAAAAAYAGADVAALTGREVE